MKTTIMLSPEELHQILDTVFTENDRSAVCLSPVQQDAIELAEDGAPQPKLWRAAR